VRSNRQKYKIAHRYFRSGLVLMLLSALAITAYAANSPNYEIPRTSIINSGGGARSSASFGISVDIIGPGILGAELSSPSYTLDSNIPNTLEESITTPSPLPSVTNVAPDNGDNDTTTDITITGTNFVNVLEVTMNDPAASVLTGPCGGLPCVDSDTSIRATVPVGLTPATYDIQVYTQEGKSAIAVGDQFTATETTPPTVTNVAPNSGPSSLSIPIAITGTDFLGASAVEFSHLIPDAHPTHALSFTPPTTDTLIIAQTPLGLPLGTYNILVTTQAGTSNPPDTVTFEIIAGGVPALSPSPYQKGMWPFEYPDGVEFPNSPNALYGTVGLWHLNGNGTDNSGNGNTATATNGASLTAAGKFLQGASFDGVDDQLIGTMSQVMNVGLTFEAWFKSPGGGEGSPRLVEISSDQTSNTSSALVYDTDGSLRGWTECQTSGLRSGEVAPTQLYDDDEWHHAAYTYDGTWGRLYVDGVEIASSNDDPCVDIEDASFFVIGAYYPDTNNTYNGLIDEVALYDRNLSPAELQDHYNRGRAQDVSGNGNHGQIVGPVTAAGQVNQALSFDGVDDFVDVGDSVSLDITSAITVEAWIYLNSYPSAGDFAPIVKKRRGGTDSYQLTIDDAGIVYGTIDTGSAQSVTSNTALILNQWYHVAYTWDGTTVTMYIDGLQDGTPLLQSGSMANTSDSVVFGYGSGLAAVFVPFSGRMDEVAVYNVALDACEINEHVNGFFAFPDGIIDGSGGNLYGALTTGAGGQSIRTVEPGVMYSYAVSAQNEGSTAGAFNLDWNTPAGWTVQMQGDCNGSGFGQYDSPCTTPSIPVGSSALYTLNVTPPIGATTTEEIIIDIQSDDPTCTAPAIVDSVKAVAAITPAPAGITAPSGLTVLVPSGSAGDTQLNVIWTDNSDNETGFKLERVMGAACTFTDPATDTIATVFSDSGQSALTGGSVFYADLGLQATTTYCYRALAFVRPNGAPLDGSGDTNSAYNTNGPQSGTTSGTADGGAPGDVSDLAVDPGSQRADSMDLGWTAPPDDASVPGVGSALTYDFRFARLPILDGDPHSDTGHVHFNDTCTAVEVSAVADPSDADPGVDCVVEPTGEPIPQMAGQFELFTVTGLIPNTIYFFVLKSEDEAVNISAMSNLAGGDNETNGLFAGRTALRTGFNLVSVPLDPTPSDPVSVFEDDIGDTPQLSRWNSSGPLETDGCYEASPLGNSDCFPQVEITAVTPGEGYFLIGGSGNPVIDVPVGSVDVTTGTNCGMSDTYPVSLDPDGGWNIIGDPFTEQVPLSGVYLRYDGNDGTCETFQTAVVAGNIGGAIYEFNGSTYVPLVCNAGSCVAVMEPWKSYWMEVIGGFTTTIELIVSDPTP
jgi:hypothetical protein